MPKMPVAMTVGELKRSLEEFGEDAVVSFIRFPDIELHVWETYGVDNPVIVLVSEDQL